MYWRLCGPQGLSGQVRYISPPQGFDPRTVQPAASHYTDWAIRPVTVKDMVGNKYFKILYIEILYISLQIHNVYEMKIPVYAQDNATFECAIVSLTLILLMWRIWWAPNNTSKWQMGFNSAFKGLIICIQCFAKKVGFEVNTTLEI